MKVVENSENGRLAKIGEYAYTFGPNERSENAGSSRGLAGSRRSQMKQMKHEIRLDQTKRLGTTNEGGRSQL
jgi:hypothetical protein